MKEEAGAKMPMEVFKKVWYRSYGEPQGHLGQKVLPTYWSFTHVSPKFYSTKDRHTVKKLP